MTAAATALRLPKFFTRARQPRVSLPPLSPRLQFVRASLLLLFILTASLLIELLVISAPVQRAAQQRAFAQFREDLAKGSVPIGPVDSKGRALRSGSSIAYIEIPEIGLRQVVVEGTTAGNLFTGPGHRRDTPLPGQEGVSVMLGRRAAFGGPFGRIHALPTGALIRVTTGQGTFDYRVSGVRREGDPAPTAPKAGASRLLLATADGRPFMPAGVLRVDADLAVPATAAPSPIFNHRTLPAEEQMMASDPTTFWALALWLQGLIAVTIGGVWAWHRWGRAKAWVVFLPPLLLIGISTSEEAARLLPNLL